MPNTQPTSNGRPFAAFDLDGTLIRWQLYHAIADALVRLGFGDPSTFQPAKEARMNWKRRSHPDSFKAYENALIEAVDTMVLSLTYAQYLQAIDNVFEEYKDQVYTFTRDLIKKLKKDGYLLLALSGSQEEIVQRIADHYGFDDYVGSSYLREGDGFSGEKIIRTHNKHQTLAELVKKHQATQWGSLAVGDTAGDITMLESVEQPIAFNPEKKLFGHARAQGWRIVVERKNVVYELEPAGQNSYTLI